MGLAGPQNRSGEACACRLCAHTSEHGAFEGQLVEHLRYEPIVQDLSSATHGAGDDHLCDLIREHREFHEVDGA